MILYTYNIALVQIYGSWTMYKVPYKYIDPGTNIQVVLGLYMICTTYNFVEASVFQVK